MTQTYQSGFKTVLAEALTPSATSIVLKTSPTVTKGRVVLVNGNVREWCSFTGVTGSTLTGVTRNLSTTADPATGSTGLLWQAGTQVILVAMHDQLPDKQQPTTFDGAIVTPDISFSGTTTPGVHLKSLTTTERDAIVMPDEGSLIFNETDSEANIYQGGSWVAVANGSTQPNASTTVAGKVEIATTAESKAGTDVGGTGAFNVVLPSDIAANTQSATFIYGVDAGGDDTYVVVLTPALPAYTAGQCLFFKPTTANTGACTVDFGPGVLNIKTKDGNDPQSGVIRANVEVSGCYDGTNFVLNLEDFATTTNKGVSELATSAETITGTDTTRTVTPAGLAARTPYSQVKTLTADVSNSSSSPTTATDLTTTLAANKQYMFTGFFQYQTNGTGTNVFKIAFDQTVSSLMNIARSGQTTAQIGSTSTTGFNIVSIPTTSSTTTMLVTGWIITTATTVVSFTIENTGNQSNILSKGAYVDITLLN